MADNKNSITTAVIPVAGFGSRMLPFTKAIEKSMVPIGTRPVIDYIVERCADAGITDIIFVVSPQSEQLKTYFGHNVPFEDYLKEHNKDHLIETLNATNRGIRFKFIEQDMSQYGTAVPIYAALPFIPDGEQFLVVMGDDFLYRQDGGNDLTDLIYGVQNGYFKHGMLTLKVPEADIPKYGIAELKPDGTLKEIVEKPQPHEVTSRLSSISKFVFDKTLLEPILTDYMRRPKTSPEYYLTDVTNELTAEAQVVIVPAKGLQMDTGSPDGLAHCWRTLIG